MSDIFQPGDPVRKRQTNGEPAIEMIVEGYDPFGRVICSFWKGTSRDTDTFWEMELEKIPLPES
jgi:uncharacterized protein YodC (DUF2158 family)